MTGEHDHARCGPCCSEFSKNIDACHVSHVPVQDHEIVFIVLELLPTRAPRACRGNSVILESQPVLNCAENGTVVIDYQNSCHVRPAPSNAGGRPHPGYSINLIPRSLAGVMRTIICLFLFVM